MLRSRNLVPGGFALLEVLITIVILAIGLLGMAGLQSKMQAQEMESFQRIQALQLLSDMADRIRTNSGQAASYVGTWGKGDTQPVPASCPTAFGFNRDLCEWSNALKGASEKTSSVNGGAMIGARGCITEVQAPNPAATVCTAGIYRVVVVWQGLNETAAPSYTCGQNLYGTDTLRRAVAANVWVGQPKCSPS